MRDASVPPPLTSSIVPPLLTGSAFRSFFQPSIRYFIDVRTSTVCDFHLFSTSFDSLIPFPRLPRQSNKRIRLDSLEKCTLLRRSSSLASQHPLSQRRFTHDRRKCPTSYARVESTFFYNPSLSFIPHPFVIDPNHRPCASQLIVHLTSTPSTSPSSRFVEVSLARSRSARDSLRQRRECLGTCSLASRL